MDHSISQKQYVEHILKNSFKSKLKCISTGNYNPERSLLPSDKHTKNYGKSQFFIFYSWVNPLFLWPFSRYLQFFCHFPWDLWDLEIPASVQALIDSEKPRRDVPKHNTFLATTDTLW